MGVGAGLAFEAGALQVVETHLRLEAGLCWKACAGPGGLQLLCSVGIAALVPLEAAPLQEIFADLRLELRGG